MQQAEQQQLEQEESKLYVNRDWSWLSFNYRVFQEAKDPNVPLLERVKFMAIYSSNLDEYFRVRIAGLRHLIRLKQKHFGGFCEYNNNYSSSAQYTICAYFFKYLGKHEGIG